MPGILCEHCTGACCRYIALPIETPEDRSDFDDIRWYLIHEEVSVFVEDGEWFISFATKCRHLRDDHMCGIYSTRPQICRDYTTENCDYHSGDYGWEEHFTSPEHLDAYVQAHFPARPNASAKTSRRRRPGRTAVRVKRRRKPAPPATVDKYSQPLPVLPWVSGNGHRQD